MIEKHVVIKKTLFYNQDTNVFMAITNDGEKISGENTTWLKNTIEGFKFNVKGVFKTSRGENILHFEEITLLDDTFFIYLKNNIGLMRADIIREMLEEHSEDECIAMFETNPMALTKYKYVGSAIAEKIGKKWVAQKGLYELSRPLSLLGLSDGFITRIYNYIEKKSMTSEAFLKEFYKNPYILTNVELVGFKTADVIALKMGIDKKSHFRLEAAILFALVEMGNNNGDTAISFTNLKNTTLELMSLKGIEDTFLRECLKNLIKEETVKELSDDNFALKKYYDYEMYILDFITSMNKVPLTPIVSDIDGFIEENEKSMRKTLGPEQKTAVKMMNSGVNAFALCGYAGTGKSTVSNVILNLFKERSVLGTAVSGIATDRIRKATKKPAVIMHYMIMPTRHKKIHAKDVDVLLIDESSMVNTEQFYWLLKQFEPYKHKLKLIFVGDKAQLPPIGPGNFFTDIIDFNLIPFVELKTIYRQAPDMILTTFAEQIRNGKVPSKYDGIFKDFEFYTQDVADFWKRKKEEDKTLEADKKKNYVKIQSILVDKYVKNVPKDYTNNVYWSDYIYGNQIISPMKKYTLGVEELNLKLQDKLAKKEKEVHFGFSHFYLYDKVVHIKNKDIDCYQGLNLERAKGSYLEKERIFNGMLGMVVDIDNHSKKVYVVYPIEQIICVYNFTELQYLNLGYAVTIHKAQGAEFGNVYIPISYSHFIMLNNKLLYTAITRAKTKVTLVGEKAAFLYACKNADKIKRTSIIQINLIDFFGK